MARSRSTSSPRSGAQPSARVLASIREGSLSPLYLLYGPDEFEKEELLKALVNASVEPAARAFNLDVFHGDDVQIADAVNCAVAFPMMAARRAVVIKRIDRLTEPDIQELLPLAQSPPETTVLILTAEKIDGRKKIFTALRKAAVCVEFRVPYESEIPDWIRKRADAMGRRIEPDAIHMLHLSVGSQLRDLANEIEKLAIYAGDRNTITRDDVARVVGASREATVFELSDAIGSRQPDRALAILKRLMEQGDHPVGVLAMLIRHIAILRKARWAQGLRLSRTELAGRLKVPPFFVSSYMEQASRFDDPALWNAYEALLEADNRLKSRSRTPSVTLSRLVYRICRMV